MMTFCSKCGAQINADNVRFCPKCGAAIETADYQPQSASTEYSSPYEPVSVSPAVRTIKQLGASPMFLIAIIAFSLSALITLLSSFSNPTAAIMSMLANIAQMAGADAFEIMEIYGVMSEYSGVFTGIRVISTIFGLIPTIILAIGLWLIFGASRKPDYVRFSTAGFTTVKVINIISLISACVSIFIIFIVMIVAAITSSAGFDAEGATAVFVVGIFLTLIIGAAVIIYYCKVIKSLNQAVRSVMDNVAYPNASRFVGVMCFISAVGAVISLIGSVVTFSFGGMMQALCGGIQSVMFGILIFKYRSDMYAASYANTQQYTPPYYQENIQM